MRCLHLLVIPCFACVISMGCAKARPSASIAPPAQTPTAAPAQPQYPVIVRVVSRNQTITISAGPRGSLYSVTTRAGEALAANLTLDQLHEQHPDAYRQIAPALAEQADPSVRSGSGIPSQELDSPPTSTADRLAPIGHAGL